MGGTLVSENAVVTAARCLFLEQKGRFAYPAEIHISKQSGGLNDLHFSCETYLKHPLFDVTLSEEHVSGPFDIAVVKLGGVTIYGQHEVSFLHPCNPHQISDRGVAFGKGRTQKYRRRFAQEVRQVVLYRYQPCQDLIDEYALDMDNSYRVCYRSNRTLIQQGISTGILPGDYGGPLVHKSMFGGEASCLIGVGSFVTNARGGLAITSVFTDVSYFTQFIQEAVEMFASAFQISFLKRASSY